MQAIFILLLILMHLALGFTDREPAKSRAGRRGRPMLMWSKRVFRSLVATVYNVGCGMSGGFLTQTSRDVCSIFRLAAI